MRKLLLILICLFVSFEVRSESNDLTGTKVFCEIKGDDFFKSGYEFVSKEIILYHELYRIDDEVKHGISNGKYKTNKSKILFTLEPTEGYPYEEKYEIDRKSLLYFRELKNKSIVDFCEVVKFDLTKHFTELVRELQISIPKNRI